ncbi:carboxylesterase/lipase family protein [Nocardia stercoris]|uniref:Carboxylic ester hydrolase n=1 Tax=Nocardia stercoris TaxID=2483361 RepID=A0A3M2L8Y2_9NOCA|nr:carboxylesterase/lipase family protein [Nocardia stercoris]RMI31018.1 carboxylesterase/lipase family protein [Nocardia stercoris]
MVHTEVTIADGVVRGLRGRRVVRWRSVPYAEPPVGELRFRAPQPLRPWTGVREATEFGLAAPQPRSGARVGLASWQRTGEDCLTLNVTVPDAPAAGPRPVLVFIHGGSYVIGTSAAYSGGRLAVRGDAVVVAINYRLGALGYVDFSEFSTAERQFDSNLGLRDQVAALRWVQRNIAAFGGDPGNVTVFGESAGAQAVVSLLATPAAGGLFHRAIAQSAPADWILRPDEARRFARRCLAAAGVRPDAAARYLTTATAADLRAAVQQTVNRAARAEPGAYPLAPVADGDFLPEPPLDAITGGRAHPVPLIMGTNRDEATLFRPESGLPITADQLSSVFARSEPGAEQRVTSRYPGYPHPRATRRIGGDFTFWRPTLAALEGHSRYAPTYAYRYDFAPRALHLAGYGATHALDLIPVFGWVDRPVGRILTVAGGSKGFRSVQDQFQDNWLAFARTGRPLPDWPPYTEQQRNTRIIDEQPRVEVDPDRAEREAWAGVRLRARVLDQR